MTTRSLSELTTLIADSVKVIEQSPASCEPYHGEINKSPHYFALQQARSQILRATEELQYLVRGPMETIMSQARSDFLPLQIIHEYQLAKLVPLKDGSSTTYDDIASASGLCERQVRRVMQSVMQYQTFAETQDGAVIHTPASRLLAEDDELQGWLDFQLGCTLPSQMNVVKAMRQHPKSCSLTHSGFSLAHDNQGLYAYLKSDLELAKSFHAGLKAEYRQGGSESFHLIQNLPQDLLKPGNKIVDVGGGDGAVMRELNQAYPKVECITQDFSCAIENKVDKLVCTENRVKFMSYDFFTYQPVDDADFYLVRNILHDWSNEECHQILARIIEVMKPSAKIIVNDWVTVGKGQIPASMERKMRRLDMTMLSLFNSGERDLHEWTDMFTHPELGLKIETLIQPPFSDFSIMILSRA